MLTVKHVDEGCEVIFPAEVVVFYPNGLDEGEQTTVGPLLRINGGEREFFGSGRAYVMNENGKTVGVYHLQGTSRTIKGQAISQN